MKKADRLRFTDPFGDYDRDGVVNIKDCEPTNPKKHAIPLLMSPWSLYDAYAAVQRKCGKDPMKSLTLRPRQHGRNFMRRFAKFWYVEKVGSKKLRF